MSDILVEVAEAVPVEVNLPAKDNAIEMEVYYQDEVSLDTDLSLFYIKSGEKEIENYVENVSKPEINNYIETYAKPIVTEVVDNIATPVIGEYIEGTVKPEISRFAEEEMAGYAEVATTQAGIATAAAAEASTTAQTVDTKVAEFDTFVGEKTEEFEQTAQQATAGSLANVEHARIWAEGEQAEVKPLGGELSSMGAADLAYALANAPEDTPIDTANMFAMNIFKGEKGDKGDKGEDGKDGLDTFTTNCITEIPQDIKLELNNGVLTLKAGSKVYVPNGFEADGVTPKFDILTIAEDKTYRWDNTGSGFVMVYLNGNLTVSSTGSGTVSSLTPAKTFKIFYNTTDNKCYFDGTTSLLQVSFPIARFTATGSITSIDQVFNGFGYIGSTVFALPNVKGLIPNGRNADGSLKNIEFTSDIIRMQTFPSSWAFTNFPVVLLTNNFGVYDPNNIVYKELENLNWNNGDKVYVNGVKVVDISVTNGVITSFTPKTAFHAVDRNDSSWVAQQAMPSSKYIDLTLGATGTSYTAPANGYFVIVAKTTASNGYIQLSAGFNGYNAISQNAASNATVICSLPIIKGKAVKLIHANITNILFRFIYSEGEN